MKYKIIYGDEEQIVIYAKENSSFLTGLIDYIEANSYEIQGYGEDNEGKILVSDEIYCFVTEAGGVFALTEDKKYKVKKRLYILEELLGNSFVKINQSCLVNIKKIDTFTAQIYGSLKIKLKNGYTDYVSRRQLKTVKERLVRKK